MKLAINLDTVSFVIPENPVSPAQAATMRRDDVLPIDVLFFAEGIRHELPDAAALSAKLNVKGTFGGTGLTTNATFTKSGTGLDTVYSSSIDLSVAAVDTAFTAASNAASIDALLEIKIVDGSTIQRTEPLAVRIQNSIHQPA
jgi:hypothetical protein